MSINNVILTGRLGKDPEVRTVSNGKSVATFSLAVDDGYGENKTTSWVRVVAWEKTADAVGEYLHKGSLVGVSGRLQQQTWEKDGEKQSILQVVASKVEFLEPKQQDAQTKPAAKTTKRAIADEDIPF